MVLVSMHCGANRVDYELDQRKSLDFHVRHLATMFNVPGEVSDYGLVVDRTFLTDKAFAAGMVDIRAGAAVHLKLQPRIQAQRSIDALRLKDKRAVFELRNQIKDHDFAYEFIQNGGVELLCEVVFESTGNMLAYALQALDTAMSFGGIESLSLEFVAQIVACLDNSNVNVCKYALQILILLVETPSISPPEETATFTQAIARTFQQHASAGAPPYTLLMRTLSSTDFSAALNSLRLITAMLQSIDVEHFPQQRRDLIRDIEASGFNATLRAQIKLSSHEDWRKELLVYQMTKMTELRDAQCTTYSKENAEHEALLMRLWELIFPDERLEARVHDQWKKMGFQGKDPATDFRGMGLLGLQNLVYYADVHTQTFRKIILEQHSRKGDHEYPVCTAGINLTRMLIDVLDLEKMVRGQSSQRLWPIFLDHAHAFEEMYSITYEVLDRTWDEMNAEYLDFPNVMAAVKKTLSAALSTDVGTLEAFAAKLGVKQTTEKGVAKSGEAKVLRSFRQGVQKEVREALRHDRVLTMQAGAMFVNIDKSAAVDAKTLPSTLPLASTFTHLKLSGTAQLDYGTSSDGKAAPHDGAHVKIAEIDKVYNGISAPYFARLKKGMTFKVINEQSPLVFSIVLRSGATIDVVGTERAQVADWTDGLRMLLGQNVECFETEDAESALIDAAVEVARMDLEGLLLPDAAPPIPPPPSTLDFCRDDDGSIKDSSKAAKRLSSNDVRRAMAQRNRRSLELRQSDLRDSSNSSSPLAGGHTGAGGASGASGIVVAAGGSFGRHTSAATTHAVGTPPMSSRELTGGDGSDELGSGARASAVPHSVSQAAQARNSPLTARRNLTYAARSGNDVDGSQSPSMMVRGNVSPRPGDSSAAGAGDAQQTMFGRGNVSPRPNADAAASNTASASASPNVLRQTGGSSSSGGSSGSTIDGKDKKSGRLGKFFGKKK